MRVLLAFLLPAMALAADNLLVNGGFEEPAAWTTARDGGMVTGAARGGQRYARVRFEDRLSQRAPVREGRWYAVRGFCRAEQATREQPRVKLYFLAADGAQVSAGGGTIDAVGPDRWTPFEITFLVPPGAGLLSVDLIGAFGGSDWFWFDDVALVVLATRSEPALTAVPDLDGKTVVVGDRADVHSFALYRVPPESYSPIDGLLATRAWTGRSDRLRHRPPVCDFDIDLAAPTRLSWVLIHALNPGRPLGAARLNIGPVGIAIPPRPAFVHSLRLAPITAERVRLRVEGAARRTAEVHEIQLFDLRDGTSLGGTAPGGSPGAPLSEAEQAVLAERFGSAVERDGSAVTDAPAGGTVTLEPGRRYSFALRDGGQAVGVRGVTLDLATAPAPAEQLLELAVREPAELDLDIAAAELADRGAARSPRLRRHADLCRFYTRRARGADRLRLGIDFPDLVLPPGEPLWVELRAPDGVLLDLAHSRLALATTTPAAARAGYLPRLERLTRRLYSRYSEACAYDGRDYRDMHLHRLVSHVLADDPGHAAATAILCRMARRMPLVTVPRPGPAGAPDWAVWGRHLQREWHAVATWWLDHRWISCGELGGDLNDDVEYSCHWPLSYLITGDDRLRRALRGIADAVWEQSGANGYSIVATDVEHAAEDSSCSLPQMLLCEYGNPVHVERMLKMSEGIPRWTAINDKGRRHFRSYIFSATMVDDREGRDIDHLYCALAMVGATHLAWYNGHPQASQWVAEYARSWAEAALSTAKGKPAGVLPCDIRFRDGELFPYTDRWDKSVYYSFGHYKMISYLVGVNRLGLDAGPELPRVAALLEGTPEQAVEQAAKSLEQWSSPPPPAGPGLRYAADKTWKSIGAEDASPYRATLRTGDQRFLVAALQECAREMERGRWLITAAEPYTDRVPVPGTTLLRHMFLGGDVAGKTNVPGLAVSWEGGGTDFAALVLDASDRSLGALVYGFHPRPQPMACRVWRLQPGRYELTFGEDRNGDGQPDDQAERRELVLRRHARVPFTLVPGRAMLVRLRQLSAEPAAQLLPDLAVAAEEVRADGASWLVPVHNLGPAATPACRVRLLAAGGKVLAETALAPLPALLDLQPKVRVQRLPRRPGGARVAVAPPPGTLEVTDENNTSALP
ncbi:MAG: hypothetical protein HYU66_15375 [Armatimonadetes bacterium]|nr:hypothetical protein [Armatimonadota bacterium]